VLELEGEARRRWLLELESRVPATAAAVVSWLAELDRLNQHDFLGGDVAATMSSPAGQRLGAAAREYASLLPELMAACGANTSWLLGSLYLHTGRLVEAVGALEEAERLALSSGQRSQLPMIRADLGLAQLNLGRLDEAAGKLQAAVSGEGVPHTMTAVQANAQVGLARLFLLRKQPRDALALAIAADDFWRDFDPKNPAGREAQRTRALAQHALAD
jgi:tetratricopeptide (TPR) repeat protein